MKDITAFWEGIGGRVSQLDPTTHDRVVAAISHLPHLVAFALVAGAHRFEPSALAFAARGFRDTTRVAASDPVVWQEIFHGNREALLASVARFRAALTEIERLVDGGDVAALQDVDRRGQGAPGGGRVRLRVRPIRRLEGSVTVPGDKSISHRAALFGALASGTTEITRIPGSRGLPAHPHRRGGPGCRGEPQGAGSIPDRRGWPARTARARERDRLRQLGHDGAAAHGASSPASPSGRCMTGDDSLRRRPMGRVADPLRGMGVTVVGRAEGTKLPLAVRGADRVKAVAYTSPMASAQVKSAVLLAGLYADSPVSVTQPALSRDHTERMLRQFGVQVTVSGLTATVTPGPLHGAVVAVPGDISSAAFLLVAGLIVPEARVTVEDVGVNPTRTGLLDVLEAMGARIERARPRASTREGGEPRASLTVTSGALRGTGVGGALIPRLIDEVPVLAVAALVSTGRTVISDAGELRVKESDRIAAIGRQLGRMGARIEERADGMVIEGGDDAPRGSRWRAAETIAWPWPSPWPA